MRLIHHNPWELMAGLGRDVDRLFGADTATAPGFVPSVDIYEEAERYVVEADLPGVDATAIELTVEGDLLTIRGEREAREIEEGTATHRRERASGRFERVFRLPETVASEGFEADYRNGVLSVAIPKAREAAPYRIEVTAN